MPSLELSAFDIDKLLKERFRREPLTLGAAWHHGYFRSYFSHAAITHPANDGLREEFSTAWDIVRKRPAVVFRGCAGAGAGGERLVELAAVRLDLPMIVGPLPYAAGVGLELAYLRAIAAADPGSDLRTRSLVVIEADRALAHAAELAPHAGALLVRLAPRHARLLARGQAEGDGPASHGTTVDDVSDDAVAAAVAADGAALAALLRGARIVELDPWGEGEGGGGGLAELAAAALAANPDLLLSVYLRYEAARPAGELAAAPLSDEPAPDEPAPDWPGESPFWARLLEAAGTDGVALVHYHAGALKSYRLTPRIDAFLKDRLVRGRVQLVSAGGDGDTQASAATVYEGVLLGANGGAMTHAAAIPLVPALVDGLTAPEGLSRRAGDELVAGALATSEPAELTELALCTLSCWQHSILDFLSCMGIDDIQKTSGNAMAITMTADWVREVDALATPEFGALNAAQNRVRVAAEPVPPEVAARYRVSALLGEREPGLPLPPAARVLADGGASYHLANSSRALNADFLEIVYRMAAGELPRLDDFFVAGDHDEYSLDRVGLRLSREAVAWSLERLARDPGALDYVSLAVPRGFLRPGAAAPGARVTLHPRRGSRGARRPAGRRARRLRDPSAPRASPRTSPRERRVALAARPRRRRPRERDRASSRDRSRRA